MVLLYYYTIQLFLLYFLSFIFQVMQLLLKQFGQ